MKKLLVSVLFLLFVLSFPNNSFAHGLGLPPFLTINNKHTVPNVLDTYGFQSDAFIIPHEQAPEQYLVNQPLTFQIDTKQLESMIAEDVLKDTVFTWSFADKETGEGKTVTHLYKKMGSYIIRLTISFKLKGDDDPVKLIDDILVHIVPYKQFKNFPDPFIKLNGKQTSKNSLQNVETINFQYPLVFDASNTKNSSSIKEYIWNFGDGTIAKGPQVTHQYKDQFFQTVVLRVIDKNGFMTDTYVGLRNNPEITNAVIHSPASKTNIGVGLLAIPIVVILVILFILIKEKRKR